MNFTNRTMTFGMSRDHAMEWLARRESPEAGILSAIGNCNDRRPPSKVPLDPSTSAASRRLRCKRERDLRRLHELKAGT